MLKQDLRKAFLNDLEASCLDSTGIIEQRKRKYRFIYIVGILILIALLVAGVLKSLSLI